MKIWDIYIDFLSAQQAQCRFTPIIQIWAIILLVRIAMAMCLLISLQSATFSLLLSLNWSLKVLVQTYSLLTPLRQCSSNKMETALFLCWGREASLGTGTIGWDWAWDTGSSGAILPPSQVRIAPSFAQSPLSLFPSSPLLLLVSIYHHFSYLPKNLTFNKPMTNS